MMRRTKVAPTLFTFNILIADAVKRRDVERVRSLVADQTSAGLAPDVVTFNQLIKLAIQLNDIEGAIQVRRARSLSACRRRCVADVLAASPRRLTACGRKCSPTRRRSTR